MRNIQPVINFAPEPCGFCQGVGSGRCRDGEVYNRCPVCNGVGAHLVAQPPKKCGFCEGEGTGSARDGYVYDQCPLCKGTGWTYVLKKGFEFDDMDL